VRLVPGGLQDRTPPVGPHADVQQDAAAHSAVGADRAHLGRGSGGGHTGPFPRSVLAPERTNRPLRRCHMA
jgi:hypothetical protein